MSALKDVPGQQVEGATAVVPPPAIHMVEFGDRLLANYFAQFLSIRSTGTFNHVYAAEGCKTLLQDANTNVLFLNFPPNLPRGKDQYAQHLAELDALIKERKPLIVVPEHLMNTVPGLLIQKYDIQAIDVHAMQLPQIEQELQRMLQQHQASAKKAV